MSRISLRAGALLLPVAIAMVAACTSGGVAGATGTPGASASPTSSASGPPSTSAEPSPSASASAASNQLKLDFVPVGTGTMTGGAILTDLGNGQTAVTIGVVAAGVTDPLPAALVPTACGAPPPSPAASAAASMAASAAPASAAPSGSAIPLTPGSTIKLGDLSAGASNTVINISLNDLLSMPYSIQIYKSAKDSTVLTCADVTR